MRELNAAEHVDDHDHPQPGPPEGDDHELAAAPEDGQAINADAAEADAAAAPADGVRVTCS